MISKISKIYLAFAIAFIPSFSSCKDNDEENIQKIKLPSYFVKYEFFKRETHLPNYIYTVPTMFVAPNGVENKNIDPAGYSVVYGPFTDLQEVGVHLINDKDVYLNYGCRILLSYSNSPFALKAETAGTGKEIKLFYKVTEKDLQ